MLSVRDSAIALSSSPDASAFAFLQFNSVKSQLKNNVNMQPRHELRYKSTIPAATASRELSIRPPP